MPKAPKSQKQLREQRQAAVTARSTSGSGFDFEDRVAASMLVTALRELPLPGVGVVSGQRLQTQVGALKWKLDDILVTGADSSGTRCLSISCKSNVQVSAAGLPIDFLSAAWSQWSAGSPMNQLTDVMMLATRGSHPDFMALWADIKSWAGGDTQLAVSRITGTAKHSRIFNAIKIGGLTTDAALSDGEVLRFVQAVVVRPYDFQLADSKDEAHALSQCRDILDPAHAKSAADLWNALVQACAQARVGHGTIDLPDQWTRLRAAFCLRERPSLEAGWKVLNALTEDSMTLVDVALPNGTRVDREAELKRLVETVQSNGVTVVYGESGGGKSSLVKDAAQGPLANWACIWLSPENAASVASSAGRAQMHIVGSLQAHLLGSAKERGLVVLDAAERIPESSRRLLGAALREVLSTVGSTGVDGSWRVVLVSQTDAVEDDRLAEILAIGVPAFHPVGSLSADDVRAALRVTQGLGWLATYDDAIEPLRNLRTLAWVVSTPYAFVPQSRDMGQWSRTTIVDCIWRQWTGGSARFHGFLVGLAIRESSQFERGQPISEFSDGEREALDSRPGSLPIREVRSRIVFVHDLASEWARFQRLKEIADGVEQWAAFASNPLWNGAIRLLGQFLLHNGRTGAESDWDKAFRKLENGSAVQKAAADLLLDSLYLDPLADRFLTERAAFFLEDDGRRLNRLLNRFLHTATVSDGLPTLMAGERSMGLYVEAKFRSPIVARWPAVARFLAAHVKSVGALMSPNVAAVCSTWLSRTPVTLGGVHMPFRREFATVALAAARAMQTEKLKGTIFIGDAERPIYEAALAGAPDLPQEVGHWALECAGRRPPDANVMEEVQRHREQQARDHAERMASDAQYRDRRSVLQAASIFSSSRRALPPWPLGPLVRVDRDFRHVCASGVGLRPMMGSDPQTASEAFLACVVEDSPEEDWDRSSSMNEEVGLEYDEGSHPTAYWKSPILAFLQINRAAALDCLDKLVGFCTERWVEAAAKAGRRGAESVDLALDDGTTRTYHGNHKVLDWPQTSSHSAGQLFCALAALEYWLCRRLDAGDDIAPELTRLLDNTTCVGVIGVLLNIGKYQPSLFTSALRPLLASHELYLWDEYRVTQSGPYQFMPTSWVYEGDTIFEMARDWYLAPYRKRTLKAIAAEMILGETSFAAFVAAAASAWAPPQGRKAQIELQILQAELDASNYATDGAPDSARKFVLPEHVGAEVEAFQVASNPRTEVLLLPFRCRQFLEQPGVLADASADNLVSYVSTNEGELIGHPDREDLATALVAAVSTVRARASSGWLGAHPAELRIVDALIATTAAELNSKAWTEAGRSLRAGNQEPFFLAHAVVGMLALTQRTGTNTRDLALSVLGSGDEAGSQALFGALYDRRNETGDETWTRLTNLGTLWAGLLGLYVRRDETGHEQWGRWLERFRRFSLVVGKDQKLIRPKDLAIRVARLYERRAAREVPDPLFGRVTRRRSRGLDDQALVATFRWLLADEVKQLPQLSSSISVHHILVMLLEFELWRRARDAEDDCKDEDGRRRTNRDEPPSKLGYAVLHTGGRLLPELSLAQARDLWQPILSLGPDAHYFVRNFLEAFLFALPGTARLEVATQQWRFMLEFALETWQSHRSHYREQMLAVLLGCGRELVLDQRPELRLAVEGMADLYERWAQEHLGRSEDSIAWFCGLLTAKTWSGMRRVGLEWLHSALQKRARDVRWSRDAAGSSLVGLLDIVLHQDAEGVRNDPLARDAFLFLTSLLVSRQVTAALALQDRALRALAR